MIRKILTWPDERLREHSAPLLPGETPAKQIIRDLGWTMYDAGGAGLAAPQIGIWARAFVIDVDWQDGKPKLRMFINPVILDRRDPVEREEGCLSFPGEKRLITRANWIKVQSFDIKGKMFVMEAEGYLAQAIQHENDHLNGVLLIDDPKRF